MAGFSVTRDEDIRLRDLGDEMFGGYGYSSEYFFQDEPYGEEGINAEAQYWGGSINPLPQTGQAIQTTSSIKMMTAHPPAHPAPWLQDRPNASLSGPNGYKNWLIRAPTPCMQVCWAIPVDDMARFLKEDWWQSVQAKYSHQALRMLPFAPEGRDMIPGSWRLVPPKMGAGWNSEKHLGSCFQSRVLARYLGDGIDHLCAHKQYNIARYLRSLAIGKSETKNFADRLRFDQRTWAPKYQQMTTLLQTVTNDLDIISNDAAAILQLPPDIWDLSSYVSVQVVIQGLQNISSGMRTAVDNAMALLEVISRDVLYTSSLIGSYHLLYDDASERQKIYDTYMRPLRQRIQQLQTDLAALKERLSQEYSNDQGTWRVQLPNQWHLASGRVNNLPPQGNTAMIAIQDSTGDIRRMIACYTSIIDKFEECQGTLHPGFVQNWDRTLDHAHAVQMARTMRHEHEERKEAAAQEMGRITSPSLLALIHGFIACIQAYLHDTPQKGLSLETLGHRREAAVEAYAEVLARQQIFELTEASPGNRTEKELEDMLQARIVQIRNDITSDPDVGGDAHDRSSSNNNGSSDGEGASGGGDAAMQGVVADLGAVALG